MPLTLYSFIINRKSGFVKAFLRSWPSKAQLSILMSATTCRSCRPCWRQSATLLPVASCRRAWGEGALPYAKGRFLIDDRMLLPENAKA